MTAMSMDLPDTLKLKLLRKTIERFVKEREKIAEHNVEDRE